MIRLAEQLERSRDQSVQAVGIAATNGAVTLEPRHDGGDTRVAIWSARRNADLLARALDLEIEVSD